MKRLTKINLPTALQIIAVLIIFLFGYPGCSSNGEAKEKPVNNVTPITSTVFSSTLK